MSGIKIDILNGWFGWLCLTSHRQRGHLETAPPFTVPCEGREARLIHRSDRDLNPGPSHKTYTVEPLLRGHPDKRPPSLERPFDNVNLNINVLISTPDERPPFLKGHFSGGKGVTSQEGFHYNYVWLFNFSENCGEFSAPLDSWRWGGRLHGWRNPA